MNMNASETNNGNASPPTFERTLREQERHSGFGSYLDAWTKLQNHKAVIDLFYSWTMDYFIPWMKEDTPSTNMKYKKHLLDNLKHFVAEYSAGLVLFLKISETCQAPIEREEIWAKIAIVNMAIQKDNYRYLILLTDAEFAKGAFQCIVTAQKRSAAKLGPSSQFSNLSFESSQSLDELIPKRPRKLMHYIQQLPIAIACDDEDALPDEARPDDALFEEVFQSKMPRYF